MFDFHLLTLFRKKQEHMFSRSANCRTATDVRGSEKAGFLGRRRLGSLVVGGREGIVVGAVLLAALLVGCGGQKTEPLPPKLSMPAKWTVVVLEDVRLADTLRTYEGQWYAETGSQWEVHHVAMEPTAASDPPPKASPPDSRDLPSRDQPSTDPNVRCLPAQKNLLQQADVVVFRSADLGELVEGGYLAPLDQEKLAPYQAVWTDLLERIREGEGRWGGQVWAVPFGSPLLVCYCRADVLERLGLRPPQTWEEYLQAAQRLHDRGQLGSAVPSDRPWSAVAEPLGPGWAGWVLLARAASYAKHPDYYSTLFDMQTMTPRIDTPPFVRALEELAAAAPLAGPTMLQDDPDQVRERFWRGECGLALCWPSRAGPEKGAPEIKCTIVPIPGASALWHPGEGKWLPAPKGELFRTPLLGISGRWAALHAHCQHPEAALELIFWLVGKQGTEPRPAVCPATAVFRKSDLKDLPRLQAWVEPAMPRQTAQQYADALQETFSSGQWLVALRIPGWQEYMGVLDEAVRAAVRGQQTPQQALQEAAEKWQAITHRLGLQHQRQAYRRNLALPD